MPDDNGKEGSAAGTAAESESNDADEEAITANGKGVTLESPKDISTSNKPSKRVSTLHLENIEERNKDTLSSDTENASPAIGPKDVSCVSLKVFLF